MSAARIRDWGLGQHYNPQALGLSSELKKIESMFGSAAQQKGTPGAGVGVRCRFTARS